VIGKYQNYHNYGLDISVSIWKGFYIITLPKALYKNPKTTAGVINTL
jgi:hypothetical protein